MAALSKCGWKVEVAEHRQVLPSKIKDRYPYIPALAIEFIEQVKSCVNGDETCWFLTAEDYARSGEPWPWDTFETMFLEDMNEQERAKVHAFWDAHLPIFFSVGGEYEYMGINVEKNSKKFGRVIEADIAYYNEPSIIAPSYETFWRDAISALNGSVTVDPTIPMHLMGAERYQKWYAAWEKAQPRKSILSRFISRAREIYEELRIILARIE